MTKIYSVNPNVITQVLTEGAAIVKTDSEQVTIINSTGYAIWSLLDGQRSLEEVTSLVASQFNTTPETVSKEVVAFTEQLLAKGFTIEEIS